MKTNEISPKVLSQFIDNAKLLVTNKKDSGKTSHGLKKLDFQADGENFSIVQVNISTLEPPSKRMYEDHTLVQVTDDQGIPLGYLSWPNNNESDCRFDSITGQTYRPESAKGATR